MPYIISHRGNLTGPKTAKYGENHPESIIHVLEELQVDCEIDLHLAEGKFYLGHDGPQFEIQEYFLFREGLWIHAKNFEALHWVLNHKDVNGFFHDKDDYTLTSRGNIWTYPNRDLKLSFDSIAVLAEQVPDWKDLDKCYGICTDYIERASST